MGLFSRKRGEGKQPLPTATGTGGSLKSKRSADSSVGILFDIDRLGGGMYGVKAYRVLLSELDPTRLVGCRFSDGDTNSTLASSARVYCIGVDAPSPEAAAYVRSAMRACHAEGLLEVGARFLDGPAVGREPLVHAGVVAPDAVLEVPEDEMLSILWFEDGSRWQVRQV